MILWINGPFGSGKTTLANNIKSKVPNSILFDPEEIGGLIHKIVPGAKSKEFQEYDVWSDLVIRGIRGLKEEFNLPIIVPMTLVDPKNNDKIFNGLSCEEIEFRHIFLEIDENTLSERIKNQIIHSADKTKDEWIRNWRLDRIEKCISAKARMPSNTIFLNSGKLNSDELLKAVLDEFKYF